MSQTKYITQHCPVIAETPTDAAYFFGFHDLCPWNEADDTLAVLRVDPNLRQVPNGTQIADICLWNPETGSVKKITETKSWNFQQGARLQWLPENRLVFNVADSEQAFARVIDLNNGSEKDLPMTVNALSPDGKKSLSPSFGRLGKYWPAYGYQGIKTPSLNNPAPQDDGLWEMDIKSGDCRLLVSIAELDDIAGKKTPKNLFRFVTHPSYSPDGTRAVFMERYMLDDGSLYTRLFSGQPSIGDWFLVLEEKVSHFDWWDNDTLLMWARHISPSIKHARQTGVLSFPVIKAILPAIKKLVKPFHQSLLKEYYAFVSVAGKNEVQPFERTLFTEDGHPMFNKNRKWMVTDTYPDSKNIQTLFIYDFERKCCIEIGQFKADITLQSDLKCDLHPRWNRANTHICVDSTHKGIRQCLIINLAIVLAQNGKGKENG
jgi:hypothetical protein